MTAVAGLSWGLIAKWVALGAAGVTVSICYGPCGDRGAMWTVLCAFGGDEFARPMLAKTFPQCIEIAETQAKARGWIP